MRWWDGDAVGYRDAAMLSDAERSDLPADAVPEHVRIGYDADKPVFIGHYWLRDEPMLLADKVACVDYSVAKQGKLVAYRYDGEPVLRQERFHWIGR